MSGYYRAVARVQNKKNADRTAAQNKKNACSLCTACNGPAFRVQNKKHTCSKCTVFTELQRLTEQEKHMFSAYSMYRTTVVRGHDKKNTSLMCSREH